MRSKARPAFNVSGGGGGGGGGAAPSPSPPLQKNELVALAVLVVVVFACLVMCPYTKVEESFNMQAIHDIIFVPNLAEYDHNQFPGVVPRTFFGALLLAGIASPVASIAVPDGGDAKVVALAARGALGALFLAAALYLGVGLNAMISNRDRARQQRRSHGRTTTSKKKLEQAEDCNNEVEGDNDTDDDLEERVRVAKIAREPTFFFPLLTPCAWLFWLMTGVFHLMFYCTRTLPNSFALVTVTLAGGFLTRGRYHAALATLGATAVIFRGDVFVLVAPLGLSLVATGRVPLMSGIGVGIASCLAAVAVTAPIDSFLWGRWLWPEGCVLFFNTVENQSHLWGTQPVHWYFSYALPRCFLGLLPFVLWASWKCVLLRYMSVSAYVFLALYSLLPHKEVRFILIVFPWLLCPLALQLAKRPVTGQQATPEEQEEATDPTEGNVDLAIVVGRRVTKANMRRAMLFGLVLMHTGATLCSSYISHFNYPGAVALDMAHDALLSPSSSSSSKHQSYYTRLHLDAYAAMSGITRFSKKHYDPLCVLSIREASSSSSSSSRGRTTTTLTTRCDQYPRVIAYNKNPVMFNNTCSSDNNINNNSESSSSSSSSLLYNVDTEAVHPPFDMIVRRREEDRCHHRRALYRKVGVANNLGRINIKAFRVEQEPFVTLWARKEK